MIVPPPKLTTPPFLATNAPSVPVDTLFPVPFKSTFEPVPSANPAIPCTSTLPFIVTVPPFVPVFVFTANPAIFCHLFVWAFASFASTFPFIVTVPSSLANPIIDLWFTAVVFTLFAVVPTFIIPLLSPI